MLTFGLGHNRSMSSISIPADQCASIAAQSRTARHLQTLLTYPDDRTRGETVFDPASGKLIVQAPPRSEEKIYPKEQALVGLVSAERLASRRILVYATHTGTRDITGRMDDILTRHGFKVVAMKADAVAPDRREAWVADRVKVGGGRDHLPSPPGAAMCAVLCVAQNLAVD